MIRKYRFDNRADAEKAYFDKCDECRNVEWLLTSILSRTNIRIGRIHNYTVGYVALKHTALVYQFSNDKKSVHRIAGVWSIDDTELSEFIRYLLSWDSTTENNQLGQLLHEAKKQAEVALHIQIME